MMSRFVARLHGALRVARGLALGAAFALVALPGAAAAPVPALTSPVVDTTGTLAAEDIARLEAQALRLQRESGSQLQILMIADTDGASIEDYAQRVFDTWQLGRKTADDGLLIVVAKDDRKVRIHTGAGLESKISDVTAARLIQEYLVPKFRRGDYAGGLDDATLVLTSLMNGEALPGPARSGGRDTSDDGRKVLVVMAVIAVTGLLMIAFAVFVGRHAFGAAIRAAANSAGASPSPSSGTDAQPSIQPSIQTWSWWWSTLNASQRGGGAGGKPGGGSGGGWSGGGGISRGGGASGGW
jgi:uncharacterized protein